MTASGKTTFADQLAPLIEELGRPVVRATIDGFHNPQEVRYRNDRQSPESYYADSFNYTALRETLLAPLLNIRDEERSVRTAVYDFRTEATVDNQSAVFSPDSILLFDGVMLFREEIDDCWDYRIYVDARLQTAFMRGVPRDATTETEQMAMGKKYLQRYFPGQRIYLAQAKPRDKADAIVMNDAPATRHILYNRQ